MKDQKRSILKQIVNGNVSGKEAANLLNRAKGGYNLIIVYVQDDGSYLIDDVRYLTMEQVKERVQGNSHVIVPEKARRLGDAIPEN
ncbi:hypothetical protein [Pontibacter lucknowensis]|uniref:Uncharacterized protein n=1 Tax=Pontibacter lucknowensis TaxID=1077936 RepID=A0A1N7A0G6_9BACT|nr:hypothetical protein [Pontibacter lucknowensis]SIR32503.1 hypothetical protein SAMN05421545_3136 [Pontibacter lucknowensis]